jgi:antitoxin VapB
MSVNLKNVEAERLLNALAEETGESLTEAATRAFDERLTRLRREREASRKRALTSLIDLIAEARGAKPVDARPLKELTDEIWGER